MRSMRLLGEDLVDEFLMGLVGRGETRFGRSGRQADWSRDRNIGGPWRENRTRKRLEGYCRYMKGVVCVVVGVAQ